MNKKVIGIIIAIIVLCAVLVGTFFLLTNKDLRNEGSSNNNNTSETIDNEKQDNETEKGDNTENETRKVLVVYFSATNNTKSVAEKIAENLNGDTFEIVPIDEYTREDLNYNNSDSRVSKEHDDETLRDVELKTTEVDHWNDYDVVFIGYPIWWGVAAWPVDTFVKANDFTGKTVIPFCTSASSGLGQSGELLEKEAHGGNWLEGHRFSSRPSDSEIKKFTDSIQ